MTKRLRKREKLDLILSELAELRAEVRTLLKRQADSASPKARAPSRPVSSRPAKKAPTKAGATPAPAKPVLVEVPPTDRPPKPTSRSA